MVRIKTVLNWLAYGIALLGFAPLFPYLEPLPRLFFPGAVAAGVLIDRTGVQVRRWLPTAASLLLFLFYVSRFSRDDLVGPAANLLVVLLAVRLCSDKSPRHYLQIYALSLFTLAGSSLFSLSPLFLGYFLLMVTLIAVSLVLLTFHVTSATQAVSRAGLRRIVSVALVLPVASLPLLLLFFFILPRTQYPLWNVLNVGGAKTVGFSTKVEPGTARSVESGRAVAFRVACEKIPRDRLYWRGIVFNAVEGNAWVRKEPPAGERGGAETGATVRQTIFPEPGRPPQLLALNVPRAVSGLRFKAYPDGTFERSGAAGGRVRYEALSTPSDAIAVRNGVDTAFYLQLPPHPSPRMVELGAKIAREGATDAERLARLGEYFRVGRYTYATSALPVGAQPLDAFLFEAKKGTCEYFASSCAEVLRLAGVPARLVGGYYGGDYNELGGYYVITEDMAHVWVEAFVGGRGWVTVDPTRWAANFSARGETRERGLVRRAVMALDALGYYWNLAVINYDLERQVRLIAGAGGQLQHLAVPGRIGYRLLYVLIPLLCVPAALRLVRRRRISTEERLLRRFLAGVRNAYGTKPGAATGLHELAARLHDPDVDRFVATFGAAVYRDRPLTPAEVGLLGGVVREIRRKKPLGADARDKP